MEASFEECGEGGLYATACTGSSRTSYELAQSTEERPSGKPTATQGIGANQSQACDETPQGVLNMALIVQNGDIFKSGAEAIVNPVNAQGKVRGGLAKVFMDRFPENHRKYVPPARMER